MRALLLAVSLCILTLVPGSGNADDRLHQITVTPNAVTYRGYYVDLSEIAGRPNFGPIADALRHQLDIVENVGLSPGVLKFFHTIPIVAGEVACLIRPPDVPPNDMAIACFGPEQVWRPQRPSREFTAWDSNKFQWTNPDAEDLAEDTRRGIIMTRPLVLDAHRPTMLHELLHAYHADMIPKGFQNPDILLHYNLAKSEKLYPADAYLLTNEKEFFAVTASVFLYGKDGRFTRSDLKQKQPDYYKYLVRLFELDPDGAPVASRTSPALVQNSPATAKSGVE